MRRRLVLGNFIIFMLLKFSDMEYFAVFVLYLMFHNGER